MRPAIFAGGERKRPECPLTVPALPAGSPQGEEAAPDVASEEKTGYALHVSAGSDVTGNLPCHSLRVVHDGTAPA